MPTAKCPSLTQLYSANLERKLGEPENAKGVRIRIAGERARSCITTTMSKSSSKRPSYARYALLVLFGALLATGLAEASLRVINALFHPPIYELDEQLGWHHRALCDRYLTNENGRDIRFVTDNKRHRISPLQESKQGQLVLFVGDSFTEASQVEATEAFPAMVAAEVAGVTYCNAGVGGYSTLQQLLALQSEIQTIAPAMVVVTIYENDFADNLMPYFSGLGPRPYLNLSTANIRTVTELNIDAFERYLQPAWGAYWLYQHSAIYRSIHKNLFLPRQSNALARLESHARSQFSTADLRRAMHHLIKKMVSTVRSSDAEILITAIPTREAVQRGEAASHSWLKTTCAELGVPFLSLLDALRKETAERAYFAKDIHLTKAGHSCIAKLLSPQVASQLQR